MAHAGPQPHQRDPTGPDLFWAHGYAATSIQDLVDVLEVQRGSLYKAFGDKHSLLLRAVDLYRQQNKANLEKALTAGPVLPVLRQMLLQPAIITGASGTDAPRGCLVGNTTAQLAPGDHAARSLINRAFEEFVEVVAAGLRRAQTSGEIRVDTSPEVQAQLLLLLF